MSTFFEKILKEIYQRVKQFGPTADQARHYVGPDLGPNCLQKLSADVALIVGKELKIVSI